MHIAGGDVEYLTTRGGEPVTIYAHGLLGSIAQTRTLARGVAGTATFLHFRGHGRSRARDDRWNYPALAGELGAVADLVGATRALGVSLGAGAILASLVSQPDRFERAALLLPAAVDVPRDGVAQSIWASLAARMARADAAGVATALLAAQPPAVTGSPEVVRHYQRLAEFLVGTGSPAQLAAALRAFPRAAPVADRDLLRAVRAPVLVVGQRDDPLHPVEVAEELAGLLPAGQLHVLSSADALWSGRAEVRAVLTEFLGEH